MKKTLPQELLECAAAMPPSIDASSCWMLVSDWAETRGGALFKTKASIDWFIKQNRRELIEADALLPGRGRHGALVHSEKFSLTVLRILKRKALEKADAAAAGAGASK